MFPRNRISSMPVRYESQNHIQKSGEEKGPNNMDIDDAFDPSDEREMDRILGDQENYFKILDDTPEYEFNLKYLFDGDDTTDFDFFDRA